MNKIRKIIFASCPLIFLGCNLDQGSSSYRNEEIVHNEYYNKLQADPDFKLKVQDLDLDYDIKKENVWCYSLAKNDTDRAKTLIRYLREDIPLECDDADALVGPSPCVIDSKELDKAAKEHSEDMADNGMVTDVGSDGSTPKERAKRDGYDGNYVVEKVLVQDVGAGESIPHMVEKAMKSRSGFCSMVLDKKALHLSVEYAKKGDKAYWTFMYGDDRD
jgi:hypothetical protein